MKYLTCLLALLMGSSNNSYAVEKISELPSTQIHNLEPVLEDVKKKTKVPVYFPTTIMGQSGNHYYAYAEPSLAENYAYIMYVDTTEDCHGAHYCNAGIVQAQTNGKIEKEFLMDGKTEVKKSPLKLNNNIVGYYTPGFALGDYHPAKIQWVDKSILYTIAGFNTENPKDFEKMANSAMKAETKKSK